MLCRRRRTYSQSVRHGIRPLGASIRFYASISSLKVPWRRDRNLDQAIENDKPWKLCARLVREVLNEPGQVISLRYLQNRRERLSLPVNVPTFLARNPGLFDTYSGRIRPDSDPVPYLRPSVPLRRFLEEESEIYTRNESFLVSKLCKLLMMSRDRVISADKLFEAKRDFGFPNDFLTNLVPRHPELFRLIKPPGSAKSFLQLVSWKDDFARSVIQRRSEEESRLTGIRIMPAFNWTLPPGFFIKKEMREWVRDWMELPYISPYADSSHLGPSSREMEKRTVAVFHELLSLSILKRVPVPVLGKFGEEYRFSNAFPNLFTRHPGVFYVSLKGGIKTAVLREAYEGDRLVDRDPILEIKDRFVELLDEGRRWESEKKLQKRTIEEDMKFVATTRAMIEDQS
ncbi:unnamed protein product [Cuscuta campestris]|uniref:PORR domain-containing protein n=1 Tax=Cuscuta campestris TaxID=132261 RepID=A0A484N4B8_9ASTE|nr:unnamed protein product [Cuscuta campestris]